MSVSGGGYVFDEGTIYVFANIIRSDDASTYKTVQPKKEASGQRYVFDRLNSPEWHWIQVWLFKATYTDGFTVEVQVNEADFPDQNDAKPQAKRFAQAIGLLPKALRQGLDTVTIHGRKALFGGQTTNIPPGGGLVGNLVVYTKEADEYEANWKCLNEAIAHELVHVSFDPSYASDAEWTQAQTADGIYISSYAAVDNGTREDLAESFVPYIGVQYWPSRVSTANQNLVLKNIPHRLEFFSAQNFDMSPLPPPHTGPPGSR